MLVHTHTHTHTHICAHTHTHTHTHTHMHTHTHIYTHIHARTHTHLHTHTHTHTHIYTLIQTHTCGHRDMHTNGHSQSTRKFCIYMSNIIMDLCNQLCLAGRPSGKAKILMLGITRRFFKQIVSYLPCIDFTILYNFHWPWSWLGSQCQHKAKPFSSIFNDEIWCGVKAVQVEHLDVTFESDLFKDRK